MRKIVIIILAFIFLYACEEEKVVINELNISLDSVQKSASGIEPLNYTRVNIYPNPFLNILNLEYSGANSCEIYIYNYEGSGKNFVIEDGNKLRFDFSNEKDGAYIIEILIDGTVFREFVVKGKKL